MPPPRTEPPLGAEMDRWVGQRVRMRRMALGMTMGRVGDKIGVSRQQIEKWEHANLRLTTGQLFVLAGALDVHPGWFFDDFPIGTVPANGAADVDLVMKLPDAMPLLLAFARLTKAEREAATLLLSSIGENRVPGLEGGTAADVAT